MRAHAKLRQHMTRDESAKNENPSIDVLFQENRRMITSAVRLIVGPSDEVEDLVQTAFVEIFKSLARFQGKSSITTWMYRIAVNVALQHRRKKRRWGWIRPFFHEQGAELYSGPHPVARLESRQALEKLDGLLSQLSDAKRAIFVLVEVQGMTTREAAEALNINPNTARSRLHAARAEVLHLAQESGAQHD